MAMKNDGTWWLQGCTKRLCLAAAGAWSWVKWAKMSMIQMWAMMASWISKGHKDMLGLNARRAKTWRSWSMMRFGETVKDQRMIGIERNRPRVAWREKGACNMQRQRGTDYVTALDQKETNPATGVKRIELSLRSDCIKQRVAVHINPLNHSVLWKLYL